MTEPLKKIENPRLILVEGKEEVVILKKYLDTLGISGVQVKDLGGKDRFPPLIKQLPKIEGFNTLVSIGVIRDADDNPGAARESIENALREADIDLEGESPSVAILIVPSESRVGAIEDLFLDSINGTDIRDCIENYFECLENNKVPIPRPHKLSKGKVHVFLGAQEEPDKRLGESVEASYWNLDSESLNVLRDFVLALQLDSE